MVSLKKIFKISEIILLILSIFQIHSCKKALIESDNDKYEIEMNGVYRISRITHFVGNNVPDYEKLFDYSDKYLKVYSGGVLTSTYFLNNAGLADSCLEGTYLTKYHYDNNNYLTSYNDPVNTVYYEYADGNRTKRTWGTAKIYYQYNSLINIIDIYSFQGTYLGKLNKNLRQFTRLEFAMASNGLSTVYQYFLNSGGLVVKRIGITTYNSGESQKKSITIFEYFINK